MPESACFLKVLLHLPATHLTSLFYLFDSSFSLKKEISLVRILHLSTWILSQVFLNLRQFFKSTSQFPCFREACERRLIQSVPKWQQI